jgi:hypothetical protein
MTIKRGEKMKLLISLVLLACAACAAPGVPVNQMRILHRGQPLCVAYVEAMQEGEDPVFMVYYSDAPECSMVFEQEPE